MSDASKREPLMSEDSRCCGIGTCIINEEGQCWCGQRWDGEKMCFPRAIRVAVVGAGIAGLSCATRLQAQGLQVEVFEKSRGASGRMSTRQSEEASADHGAQYFTARDPLFMKAVSAWMQADVAAVWQPQLKVYEASQWRDSHAQEKRYVGKPAMNTPGKYLAQNVSAQYGQTIDKIAIKNRQWHLHSAESGDLEQAFDWLVLALPAPQALALLETSGEPLDTSTAQFKMKGCWTVMAEFTENLHLPFDAAFVNGEIISWMARNNSKPGRSGAESWTIHATPEWSQEWIELEKEEAAKRILGCAQKIGLVAQPAKISVHRWRYASGSLDPMPLFKLDEKLKWGLCGDWLNGGRVEGAWLSGHHLATEIQTLERALVKR